MKDNKLNHGYLLVGDRESAKEYALKIAKEVLLGKESQKSLESHPDFFYKKFELFGIKDSIDLRQKASMRPIAGEKRMFVLEISYFSVEASNALLKTFEEPAKGIHFFVIAPSIDDIISTLRSRLVVIKFSKEHKIDKETRGFYMKFLKALPSKRLEIVNGLLTKEFAEDKKKAIEFLNEIEFIIGQKLINQKEKDMDKTIKALGEIKEKREYLFDRVSSIKMILEHLALTLPQM